MAKFEKNGTKGTLTFSITQEELKPALDKAFNKVKGKVNIPGFRKGKVSRVAFNKMIGEESLYNDALEFAFPVAYDKALKEEGVREDVVGQPSITDLKTEKGEDWTLTIETDLKPEVTLGDYKEVEIPKQEREVTEADVEANLEEKRKANAELVLKEEEASVEGDTVVIDFEGFVDGEAFEGGKGENHSLELGSKQFIPGFEEQLIGKKAGESVEVNVTFPEDYQAKDLAGKAALFQTTIHEVKAKELPELDDEFAKDVDDAVETLDELKTKIQKELEEKKQQQAEEAHDELAIRTAVENATIGELPESMVHEEVHNQMNQFLSGLQQQGVNKELYFQITGTTEEDLHKQYEEISVDRVRTNLVVEAIVKAEDFQVTDEEVEKEVADLAEMYKIPVEQVQNVLSKDMLHHDILMKKAIELVTSSAKEV